MWNQQHARIPAQATPLCFLAAALVAALVAAPTAAHAAGPTSGVHPNVWILDSEGVPVASYQLTSPGFSLDTRAAGPGIEVLVDGVWTLIPSALAASDFALVNRVSGSWPKSGAVLPPVSVMGLGDALHSAADPARPGVSITPGDGVFDETTRVRIRAVAAFGNPNPVSLRYRINGGPWLSPSTIETSHWVVASGVHTIEGEASQLDSLGALRTYAITRTIEMASPDGNNRDTDGDGVPDRVEVAWRDDPLVAGDPTVDQDGDGWGDWQERLRGSDPESDASVPADSDGDGWSDWDETVRGTNPADDSDLPSARRLMEVETLLTGTGSLDGSTPATAGDLQIWGALTPQAAWYAASGTSLAVWGPIRVPAGEAAVVYLQQGAAETPGAQWDAKAWLAPLPDVTWEELGEAVAASGAPWAGPAPWLGLIEAELTSRLVVNRTADVTPESTALVALVESVVAWTAGVETGAPCQLTGPYGPTCLDATASVDASSITGALGPLYELLASEAVPGGYLAGALLSATTVYSDPSVVAHTTSYELSRQWQQDASATLIRYRARLLRGYDDALAGLPPAALATALIPAADADGDGIKNSAELGLLEANATNPLAADTDGDSRADGSDPCPLDPLEQCLVDQAAAKDTDGDGWADAVDNCIGHFNLDQTDANGDGIGDSCEAPARIRQPSYHPTVVVGANVSFQAVQSLNGVPPVQVEWRQSGVVLSTAPSPPAFSFGVSGIQTIELWVRDAVHPAFALADSRKVTVLP